MNRAQSGFQLPDSGSENYQEFVSLIMEPFVAAVVERAHLVEGQSVLDVACGTGFVARAAAPEVGPRGRVVGLDINESMLSVARAVPAQNNANIAWHRASALEMPFNDGEFDAVLCQQGIMFFPDLNKGLSEMARVAASTGTLVVSFWAPIEKSPYMLAYSTRLASLVPAGSLATNDVAFGLGRDTVERILRNLGFSRVESETIAPQISLPSVAEFLPPHLNSLPYGGAFASLDAETRRKFVDDVAGDLALYQQADGRLLLPFSSHIVTARR